LYEKALTGGLGNYVHFEDIVKRFSLTDLEYLLKGANRLKFTYLYSKDRGLPHGEELRRWVEAGVIADEAQQARKAGYTLDMLQEAIKLGVLIDGSVSRETWRSQLISTPTTVEYLQACVSARLNSSWVKAGLDSKAPVELLQTLRAMDVPPRYVPCALRVCKSGTVVDCDAARRWYIAGVSPKAAKGFINARAEAEVALAWLRAGFLPTEAIRQIKSGVSLESAKAQTAKVPFSKAFRRDGRVYGIRREFKDRVSKAVDVLDVPSYRRSGMFSFAETRVAFLDGGYVEHEGYGWGSSHSYTMIIGNDAALLVCHRIGVQPPRRQREASPSRSAEDLEAMLQDQRLNRWNDLVAQATRPGFIRQAGSEANR
jgi:hypothetical protein